jgi:hypothetical protein
MESLVFDKIMFKGTEDISVEVDCGWFNLYSMP